MFDPPQNTLQPIMTPVEGIMITDLVAGPSRAPPPDIILDKVPGVSISGKALNWSTRASASSTYAASMTSTASTRPMPNIATLANPVMTPATQRARRASSAW